MLPTIFRSKFFVSNSFVNSFSRKSTNLTKNDYLMLKDKIQTNKELKDNNSVIFQIESTTSANHNNNNDQFSSISNLSRMQRNQKSGRYEESINQLYDPRNPQLPYNFLNQFINCNPRYNHFGLNQQNFYNNNNTNNCYLNQYRFDVRNINLRQNSLSSDRNFHRPDTRQFSVSSEQGQGSTNQQVNAKQKITLDRSWEIFNSKKDYGENDFIFTVMSYNVLAQDLIIQHPYLYVKHKNSCLNWSYRWNNLWEEIKTLKPDILCLQEVQSSHIRNYYSQLKKLGYNEIFKQRTGVRTDGCAIFFKNDVIELIEYTTVEYNQPTIKILDRDNVAIVAKFISKNHLDKEFILATTHLLYNPKRQDVRLAQMQLLLTEIDRLAFKTNPKLITNYLPVILTGDLNSTPSSKLYQFITNGELKNRNLVPSSLGITDHCQHADLITIRSNKQNISREQEIDLIKLKHSEWEFKEKVRDQINLDMNLFSSGILTHQFPFKSVYNHYTRSGPEGTTFQDEWLTVDYIFYSVKKNRTKSVENVLKLLGRYKLPTTQQLKNMNIPNENLGSDHLCLMAKFKL